MFLIPKKFHEKVFLCPSSEKKTLHWKDTHYMMTSHEGEDLSNFLIDLNTVAFWHEWCSVPNEDNTKYEEKMFKK